MKTQKTLNKQAVFSSMAQAASMLGVPKEKLKEWKNRGAAGFTGGRVYADRLDKWCKQNLEKDDYSALIASRVMAAMRRSCPELLAKYGCDDE